MANLLEWCEIIFPCLKKNRVESDAEKKEDEYYENFTNKENVVSEQVKLKKTITNERDLTQSQLVKIALQITGEYETSGKLWKTSVGNFDGMGVSAGILQWNFGTGSLQELVQRFLKRHNKALLYFYMPTIGSEFRKISFMNKEDSVRAVKEWSSGTNKYNLKQPYKKEIQRLMDSKEMIKLQVEIAKQEYGTKAMKYTKQWLESFPESNLVKRPFSFFFDIRTQNGNLKGVTIDQAKKMVDDSETDLVIDWMEKATKLNYAQSKDANRNAKLWKSMLGSVSYHQKVMFCMGWLRAMKSGKKWRAVVANRKCAIAMGKGYYGGAIVNIDKYLL